MQIKTGLSGPVFYEQHTGIKGGSFNRPGGSLQYRSDVPVVILPHASTGFLYASGNKNHEYRRKIFNLYFPVAFLNPDKKTPNNLK
jgi:hypothetical protein